jgi:hypothetical protein
MTRKDVLLKALASTPADLRRAVDGLASRRTGVAATLHQWVVFETRFRAQLQQVISEDVPNLPELRLEPDDHLGEASLQELLERFSGARQETLNFLRSLSPGAWQQRAVHETLGETSLRFLVQHLVECDTQHLVRVLGVGGADQVPAKPPPQTPVGNAGYVIESNEVKDERRRTRKWPRKRV